MELPPLTRISGVHRNSSLYHQNDGFFYTCCKQMGGIFYFRCSKVGSGCHATATLKFGYFQSSIHNHPPNFLHEMYARERQKFMNEAASLQHATFGEIFNSTSNLFPTILSPHSLQPAMARNRLLALPDVPTTLVGLDNILRDERYQCLSATRCFEDSTYAGSASSHGCSVILLLSNRCKSFMKLSVSLYGFTTCFSLQGAPHQCGIHVIYTVWDGTIILLAWILMDRIHEHSFLAAFNLLKSKLPEWHVKTVLCRHGSLESVFYKQVFGVAVTFSIFDLVEDVGNFIQPDIPIHPHFKDVAVLCCALPVLPSECLAVGFQVVRAEAMKFQGLSAPTERLLQYMEYKFFNPAVHQHMSMCGDYYRTSNSVEVVKNKVLRTIDIHRNRIYSLLRHITSLAEVSARDIQDIERGAMVQRRRASSVSNQPQIINLTKELCSTASNQLNAARNLLVATSLLINHLLPN